VTNPRELYSFNALRDFRGNIRVNLCNTAQMHCVFVFHSHSVIYDMTFVINMKLVHVGVEMNVLFQRAVK
jgi:hypothetical protein